MTDDWDEDEDTAHTSDGKARPNEQYDETAAELRQFVERREQLDAEKSDIADQVKELHAELRGRGYDQKAFNRIIAIRKKEADALRELNSITLLYAQALGIDEDLL